MLVFCGFLFALHNLYWYYVPEVRAQVELFPHLYTANSTHADEPIETKAEETFGT